MNKSDSQISHTKKGPLDLASIFLKQRFQMCALVIFTLIFLAISFLYLLNLLQWSRGPDFGWSVSYQMGKTVFVEVYGGAKKAGLLVGDKIIGVNNEKISTYSQLQQYLNRDPKGENVYEVDRNGQFLTVTAPNEVLGFKNAFFKFGFTWVLGIIFFLIGAVVFFMKPGTNASWAFLITLFNAGLYIMFSFTSKLSPHLLGNMFMYASVFLSASILHITQVFPVEQRWVQKRKLFLWLPYLIAIFLFIIMRSSASLFTDLPGELKITADLSRASSFVLFLAFTLFAYIKPISVISRIRSKVILIGTALAVGVPILDLITNYFFNKMLLPNPVFFLPFYVFLPVSIGYAIVKHNLFDVDVYIKRAVGYGLMTAVVGLTYFSLQTLIRAVILRPLVGEYAEKIYPILFAVLVVFLFNPINRRVQGGVDRLFYRKKFDYKETVINVSNALTSVLNLTEVIKRIINTVRKEMFIDTAGVILLEPQKKECQTLFIGDSSDKGRDGIKDVCIPYDDPLLSLLSKEKKLVTVYDVTEDPHYRSVKESCGQRFSEMGASIAMPFIYQNEVKGALALGYKKSGHFYTREDIDLLNTLANHGAVAIENAKLVEQMKKEETVRTNLARYLSPQIVDQIITKDVQVNLGGDRKVVTVLFSDIRNFTTITETRPPDQLVQILNEYFTEMASIIFANQGSLDKYIGDAIVAVFGSLITLENSANNAVKAAIKMMKQLPVLNEKWMKQYGFSMDIGIGINTGEVFLGNIGSPERMEFTVIGDTVNVASRFSGLAKPGQILITQETLTFLGNEVMYRELPPTPVKGKTGKLEVYEVLYP
jgi:class 3 adenylate cyclase